MKRRSQIVLLTLAAFAFWAIAVSSSSRADEKPPATAAPSAGKATTPSASGREVSGVEIYRNLSRLAREGGQGAELFDRLAAESRRLDWNAARSKSFTGNLRLFEVTGREGDFYLVRSTEDEIFILALPEKADDLEKGAASPYAGLKDKVGTKMRFEVQVVTGVVGGIYYHFARLEKAPQRLLLDRLFFIAIVALLFLTMVGMGLTLTFKEFALVFTKPAGMIVGPICQFGLLPLMAMLIGRLAGYHDTYPFIFLGLILIASSPGGVTSNLMTYFGKGDVALSISLTAVCTVMALLFTPLLLSLYGSNVPDFSIPVWTVFKQILVIVIVPLFVGMGIRGKWEGFAKRAEKTFAVIGLSALLFLIVVGVLSNLDKFADTERYSWKFYTIVFVLTFSGMIVSGLLARLLRI